MKKKSIINTITFLLVLALTAGFLGYATSGFSNWNIKDWFNDPTPDTENNIVAIDNDGNNLIGGNTYPLSSSMVFTQSTLAESPLFLEATVHPAQATNKKVDWLVDWVNPSDPWALDNLDAASYIIVTPISDGSTTAKVEFSLPFGAQIKITVTSRANPNAKAECIVDSVSRVYRVGANILVGGHNFELSSSSLQEHIIIDKSILFAGSKFSMSELEVETYKGTIDEDYDISVIYRGTDEMLTKLSGISTALKSTSLHWSDTLEQEALKGGSVIYDWDAIASGMPFFGFLYEMQKNKNIYMDFLSALNENYSIPFMEIEIRVQGEYSSFSYVIELKATTETFYIGAESITLDQTTIIF